MGIPRLTQDLSGYTEVAVLGADPVVKDGEVHISKVVIDGPSLVYHVYAGLCRSLRATEIASAIVPSYSDVVIGIKSFLNVLQSHAVAVEAILFDGDLPISKRSVRLERMENIRKQLEDFRKLHAELQPFETAVSIMPEDSRDIFKQPVFKARNALPPLPFLVPAVLDAAKLFGDISNVRVVPEEADVACARLARASGAAVLTNDSDMALYDVGPEGCVLVLRTFMSTHAEGLRSSKSTSSHGSKTGGNDQRLLVSCLRPAQIAQRLSLPSLLCLGFERSLDSSVSTSTVVQSAKESSTNVEKRQKFDEFRKQFEIPESAPSCHPFDDLDPRISEFITQAKTSSDSPHVYLPILHEDPFRDSSWTYGLVYRQLAYSVYYSSSGRDGSGHVIEYVRKGSRIVAASVPILDDTRISATLKRMLENLAGLAQRLGPGRCGEPCRRDISSVSEWYALALCIVVQHKLATEKTAPTHQDINRLFGLGGEAKPTQTFTPTWDDIHLLANAQAVLYSWRLLNRIIYWTIHNPSMGADTQNKVFSKDLGTLKTWQATMPMISELFLNLWQLRTVEDSERRANASAVVKRLRDLQVGGNAPTHARDHGNDIGDETRKRRKKSKPVSQPERVERWTGRNAFGILADDMADGGEEDDDDDDDDDE